MTARHSFAAFCIMLVGSLYITSPTLAAEQAKAKRPNILFIMSDDHTSQAWGCYDTRFSPLDPTPNIDRLADQGARLDNAFCTNSICSPSRATIMTGLYSHKNGVRMLSEPLDPEMPNLAKLLHASGYTTAIVGKWHLKTEPAGFDYWKVLPGQGRYFDPQFRIPGSNENETIPGHSTDVIANLALEWLDEGRDADKPFLLMCHFKACHEPWQYAPRYAKLYQDTVFPEPESYFEDQSHRSLATRDKGFTIAGTHAPRMMKGGHVPEKLVYREGSTDHEKAQQAYQHMMKAYFRTVRGIDDNIGRLIDYLDRAGLADNTVVIYTSDQGYFLGEHGYTDKRWMFEESLRMPMVVRYPGEIRPGTTCDDLVINPDFAPTMLDLAGLSTPDWMQGRSFRANLRGETPDDWRDAMYYHYWTQSELRPSHFGVRTKNFKLMYFYGNDRPGYKKQDAWELYDLRSDPHELKNVYTDPRYTETIVELEKEIRQQQQTLEEPTPEIIEKINRALQKRSL